MSFQVEKLEKNMAKITVEVPAQELENAIQSVYMKMKKDIAMPGFRKGKVPRVLVEKAYGPGVFFEDASNELINSEYPKAADESGLDIMTRPRVSVVQIEKGKPFIFTAEVALRPEVELGQYKGVEVPAQKIKVIPEEIEAELHIQQRKNGRTMTIEKRPAQIGDTAIIDYIGMIDGESFEGGAGDKYSLILGSHSFIPGFEEQIVGMNPGDEKDVVCTFPEDYHAKELAGKEAVFHTVLRKIELTIYPAIDDEFAQEVSEFDTLEEYKADIEKNLRERKEKTARAAKSTSATIKAANNAKIELPDMLIDDQAEQMYDSFLERLMYQGMTEEQYLNALGQTKEESIEELKPRAVENLRNRLTLEAIAKAENIEATEEQLNGQYEEMAKMYGMETDAFKGMLNDEMIEQIKHDVVLEQTSFFLADNAVEIEEPAKDAEKEKPAKKAPAKKTASKKTAEKKDTEKKAAEKKEPAKKTAAKKTEGTAKKTTAKKTTKKTEE